MRRWAYDWADYPNSVKWGKSDIPDNELCQAYFQDRWELPEEITQNWQYSELDEGWDIIIQVEPCTFGHWLGYDAHRVAEGRI